MRARIRTAAVLAAAAAAVTLAGAGCGGDDEPTASPATTETTHQGHTTTAATSPTATPTPKPKPNPGVRTFTIVVKQGRPQGGIKTYTVKQGEQVAVVVRSDAGESFHVHGYWLEKAINPGAATRIAFTAKTPGRFEIELHEPDAVLGTLQVEP